MPDKTIDLGSELISSINSVPLIMLASIAMAGIVYTTQERKKERKNEN